MKIIPTLTLLFMLSYTSLASALPVRLDMLGTVSYTTVPGVVDVGDPFQLSIFYNHNAPASVTGPTSAIYTTNHITRLDIGGLFLAGSEGDITVFNDHLICPTRACFLLDLLRISSRSFDSMIGDYEVNNIVMDLMDFTDKLYDDVALPAGPSDIDMTRLFDGFYTSAYVALGSGPNFISLGISEVRISAVPLPTTAWLFGSAFLGLSIVRRKKL